MNTILTQDKGKNYIRENYKELSREDYLTEITKILNQIDDNRLLMYFCTFISEKTKGMP